jgi:hypothetical protein
MKMNEVLFKQKIKPLFSQAMHCSIATVNADGLPHVTPIGSVVLKNQGNGWFFQKFTKNIPKNAEHCEYATIMAVNNSKWYWLKSVLKGGFKTPPAMRLTVKLGNYRPATESETAKFQRRVGLFRRTKGYQMMWAGMSEIREFEIVDYKPVYVGKMTQQQFV